MAEAGGGSIINLGSISWMMGAAGVIVYTTAKSAVAGLTKSLARELGGKAIRVNCIAPGWVLTPRQVNRAKATAPEKFAQYLERQCLKEHLAPADIARLALWLAADDFAPLHGADLYRGRGCRITLSHHCPEARGVSQKVSSLIDITADDLQGGHSIMKPIRHIFGALALAGATLAPIAVRAADLTFMSFTFAEEPNKASVQKMMDGFQAATKLSVEPQGYAWGDMQKNILLRVRSNTAPDVAQLSERWLPNYAATKGVVDFNDVFGKDQLASILAPAALAMGQVNGKQLGIPLMTGSIGMIANKEVLAKAGVDKMPVTIDEFKAALVAVRDKVPNSVPYAMATKNNNSIILDYMLWTWAYGGQIIDSEGNVKVGASPAGKQALAFMAGLVKDRLAAPEIDRPDFAPPARTGRERVLFRRAAGPRTSSATSRAVARRWTPRSRR